jgi:hypothetical protein
MARAKRKTSKDNPKPLDPHYFEFDLDRAIREQVVEALERSPLIQLQVNIGPKTSGIYALYHKRKLVYVGKASMGTTQSKRSLRGRLGIHARKIASRQNIKLEDVRCRFLTMTSEWWVFAAEFALITHYKPAWNGSGFGSNLPGIGRPGRPDRISRWNAQFPPRTN